MQWFRLYAEIIDDEKLRLLAFEDRWHFVAILACKASGILDAGDPRELLVRKLKVKLGLDQAAFDEATRRLAEVGLIDLDTFQPVRWDSRQFASDRSTDRVHAFRERKRVMKQGETFQKRFRNSPDTDTDTDTERASSPDGEESTRGVDVQPPPTSVGQTRKARCPYGEIVDLYHAKLPMCRRVELLTDARKASIRGRWFDELPTVEAFGNYFDDVARSRFLTGRVDAREGRKPFVANIDWLMKPSNLAKVLEGNYHDG